MGTFIIILLTTISVNMAGTKEIHMYSAKDLASCATVAQEWKAAQASENASSAPAFRTVYDATCDVHVVGVPRHA